MSYINFDTYALEFLSVPEKILRFLNEEPVDEQTVWEIGRESKEAPCFEDILYEETYEKLKVLLQERYNIEMNYHVNYRDSSMNIDGNDVNSLSEFKRLAAVAIWTNLGDIPNDEDGGLEEAFLSFEAGTDREDIWLWIEERFDVSAAENLMYVGEE